MVTAKESIRENLYARVYLYTTLRILFGEEPSRERYDEIDSSLVGEALEIVGVSDSQGFVHALEEAKTDIPATKDLYTRLFIGLSKLPAPPWESCYEEDGQVLFTPGTLEVRNAYRDSGLLPERYPHVADDHLSLELAFLASLAQRMCDSFEKDEDAFRLGANESKRFLEQHLLRWIDRFAEDLWRDSPQSLYTQAANTLVSFAHQDAVSIERIGIQP